MYMTFKPGIPCRPNDIVIIIKIILALYLNSVGP